MKQLTRPMAALLATGLLAAATTSTLAAADSAATPAQSAPKLGDFFANVLVAKGKGMEVKRSQLDEEMVGLKANAAANGQKLSNEQVALLEQQVLQRLIQVQLLGAKATEADKTAAQELSARRYETIKNRLGSEENLRRRLKAADTTPETLQRKILAECIAEKVLEREMKVLITSEDAKKYYDENPAKFELPERVKVAHILLGTRDAEGKELAEDKKAAKLKQAEDLVKRARNGDDFTKLVSEFSEDPGSKDSGGIYSFARASADPRNAMVPEFEAASFSLQKTNQISDVVTTQFGYHVIRLVEKIPAEKLLLAKIENDLKDALTQEAMKNKQQEVLDYMRKLHKDAAVEVLDEKLKPAEAPPAAAAAPRPAAPDAKKPEAK